MRRGVKDVLARTASRRPATGLTILTYHRVGGGSPDERDVSVEDFEQHLRVLRRHDVVSLDAALDRLEQGDRRPSVVLTFDDGFRDVHENAWPLLRAEAMPFTLYLATAFLGGTMHWEGSTARAPGPALTWAMVEEMAGSGLATLGNHTHRHARPEVADEQELDDCTSALRSRLGVTPRHYAYPWGVVTPGLDAGLRSRFRSAVTGEVGRNLPGADAMRLRRVPVRRTDPPRFVAAKLTGALGPERAYDRIVSVAKAAGLRG